MFDLQDEPDAFTVYQGEVQEIPQTLLSRKVNCWEVKGTTLHLFVLDTELTENERKKTDEPSNTEQWNTQLFI